MTVFDRALLESFDDSIRPVNEARLLPSVVYTSEEVFDFEKQAVFNEEWLCVGRDGQIPARGDFYTTTFLDEPLIVARGKDGAVRVFSAVCQHRGMVVAEGSGHCTTFTCPYHHWIYGTDGRLLGAPAMERAVDFDKGAYGLPPLPVEVWEGFIFTTFTDNPKPLAPSLAKISARLKNFELSTSVTRVGKTLEHLPWNWKVMMENFNDPYHASRLHGHLQDFAPSHLNEFLDWDDDDNAVGRIQHFTCIDGSFNPTMTCLLPVFPRLTEAERSCGMFVLIPPTLALAVVPDEVAYFVIVPEDAQHITIHIGYCFDPDAVNQPLFDLLLDQAEEGVDNFNVQDIYADKMVQVGLRSRFGPRGRYSWQEETLRQFNRWLVRRYRQHWPATTDRSG